MDFKISEKTNSIINIVKIFIYVFLIIPLLGVSFIFITVITFILALAGVKVCENIFEVCASIFMYIIEHTPHYILDILENILELLYKPIEPLVDEFGIYFILIFIFVCILFYCLACYFSIVVLKKLKYLQKTGFISADNNELRLFMGLRIATVKWDNVAEIKIVKQGQLNVAKNDVVDDNSDKDCLCINFVSLDVFPHSLVNMFNVKKTNYGFHVVYYSSYFEKDVNEIYSELTKYIENHH